MKKKIYKKNFTNYTIIFLLFVIAINTSLLLYMERKRITDKLSKIFLNYSYKEEKKQKEYELAKEILKGGYILFIRHAERYKAEPYQAVQTYDAYELNNKILAENSFFSQMVCLNKEGKMQGKLIGEIFRDLDVPISKIISSPSCRARQTAMLAFGKIDKIYNSLLHTGPFNENSTELIKNIKKIILSQDSDKKKNIIITGHNSVIKRGIFDKVYDENLVYWLEEGGFYVIKKVKNELVLIHKYKSLNNFTKALYKRPKD